MDIYALSMQADRYTISFANYYGSHNIDTEKIPKYSCFIIFKFQHRSDFLSLFKSISFRPTFI